MRAWKSSIVISLVVLAFTAAAPASVEINYLGSGAASGLNGKAVFNLLNANQLCVILTNTSSPSFGGVDGDASMVLSSINFNLGGVDITGGSVMLHGLSKVVENDGGTWTPFVSYVNLDRQYGYTNDGIGNSDDESPIFVGVTLSDVENLYQGAVTSHSNGGTGVTLFSGDPGPAPQGLDFGLVANGSTAFGSKRFISDSVKITLNLSGAGLANLDFLSAGSYVEFGSDYAYVGGVPTPTGGGGPGAPEPVSLMVWSLLICAGCCAARPSRQTT